MALHVSNPEPVLSVIDHIILSSYIFCVYSFTTVDSQFASQSASKTFEQLHNVLASGLRGDPVLSNPRDGDTCVSAVLYDCREKASANSN